MLDIPSEVIIQKVESKDFNFFLEQGNFYKVVDTIEKFEHA